MNLRERYHSSHKRCDLHTQLADPTRNTKAKVAHMNLKRSMTQLNLRSNFGSRPVVSAQSNSLVFIPLLMDGERSPIPIDRSMQSVDMLCELRARFAQRNFVVRRLG